MSRQRRAAPSISAAAPTAPRRRSAARSGPAWPGPPSRASAATGARSSVTSTRRVARSITGTGSSASPAARGSTRNSVSPSGVCAGTRRTSATWAHGTNRFRPESVQPLPVFSARVCAASGRQSSSVSRKAIVARASPVATAGSQRFFCASAPASSIAVAARTVGQYGPGYAARPISSRSRAVSTMPRPLPPCASGSERPSQPSCAISFHSVSLSPRGSSHKRRTVAGFTCSSRNPRAEFFRSCWSELNEKSMASGLQAVRAHFLGQAEHALTDDVLLDLRGARVDRAGARPEERGRPRAGLAGGSVDVLELLARGDELAVRPEDLERELEVAFLELRVGELGDGRRGARGVAVLQRRQHPQRGVALDLELGVGLPQPRADRGVLEERLAAAPELLRGPDELVERDRVARDASERVGAALPAERGLRDLPALVQVADEVAPLRARVGHEDLGEERGAGDLPEGAHLDAGLAHVEQDARDALVLRRLAVGAVDDDRRADEPDAEAVDGRRRPEARHLVLHDRLLHRRATPAAVLLRPQHPDVAGLIELPVPGLALVERLHVARGGVGLEPAPDLGPEGAVFSGGVQVHRSPPRRG